jgi:hypothetical protein
MSSVTIALGNSLRKRLARHFSPSTTIWICLSVSGPKPRRVASARAQASIVLRDAKLPQTRLLIGPCSLPSAPRRSVYMATSVALRPFLLLSPFLRRFFDPRVWRALRPRCR